MDVDVELVGESELDARLAHAHAGLLTLDKDLASQLERTTPPMQLADSPRMRPRTWGAGDVWALPAGGWITRRIQLPDDVEDKATDYLQQLLDE